MPRLRPFPLLAALAALVVIACTPAVASAAAYDESTSYQVTTGHTGFASGGSLEAPPLRTRWTRTLGTTRYPLIADGRVFAVARESGHAGDTLFALDGATGATLWSRAIAGYGYIALDGGRVFIAEDSGTVQAVAADSGATLWTRNLPEPFTLQMPVAADGTVYVATAWSGGSVYALDAVNGSTRWVSSFYYGGSPAVDGRFLYISDDYEGFTTALSRTDGSRAWSGGKECFVSSGRAVTDGARVIAPYNSGCGSIGDAATGRQLDTFASSNAPATAGDVTVSLSGSALLARSLSTGVSMWEFRGDGSLSGPPLIVNETVYIRSSKGVLFAVDLRTGQPVWNGAIAAESTSQWPMAAGGGLLVVPAGTTLTAMESVSLPRLGLDLRITAGPDGPTRESSATLSFGSSNAAALQSCRLDRGAWTPCLSSVTYPALADGPHMFEVQTRDLDGSTIALATRGWSVDTAVPAATISGGPAARTTSTWASFTIKSDDASAVRECRLDEGTWATCGNSYSSVVEYSALANGPHRFEARARDGVGNVQATPASHTWTVDTQAPRSTIDAGPQGATSETDAVFVFSADEPATFECSMDFAPLAACSSPFAMQGVAAGTHTFLVLARDLAGNREYSGRSRTWTVGAPPADTTPPDTALVSAPPLVTAATSARFTATAESGSTLQCRLDFGAWYACGSTTDVASLADGTHDFAIRAVDQAGNVDPTPASWSWTVDTNTPRTSARLVSASPSSGYSFDFEADEKATFECTLDANGWIPCASGVTVKDLAAGTHEFRVRATDIAGNVESEGAAVRFTVPSGGGGTAFVPQPKPGTAPSTTNALAAQLEPPALVRQIAAQAAAVLGRSTRAQLRRGRDVPFYVVQPGRIDIVVTARRNGRSFTVAKGRANTAGGRVELVRVRFTSAGRRTLARKPKLALRVRATITPVRGSGATAVASTRV
jgi:outer membrane protein assembly factor BamB